MWLAAVLASGADLIRCSSEALELSSALMCMRFCCDVKRDDGLLLLRATRGRFDESLSPERADSLRLRAVGLSLISTRPPCVSHEFSELLSREIANVRAALSAYRKVHERQVAY